MEEYYYKHESYSYNMREQLLETLSSYTHNTKFKFT